MSKPEIIIFYFHHHHHDDTQRRPDTELDLLWTNYCNVWPYCVCYIRVNWKYNQNLIVVTAANEHIIWMNVCQCRDYYDVRNVFRIYVLYWFSSSSFYTYFADIGSTTSLQSSFSFIQLNLHIMYRTKWSVYSNTCKSFSVKNVGTVERKRLDEQK